MGGQCFPGFQRLRLGGAFGFEGVLGSHLDFDLMQGGVQDELHLSVAACRASGPARRCRFYGRQTTRPDRSGWDMAWRTLNPTPHTLNPKPQTLTMELFVGLPQGLGSCAGSRCLRLPPEPEPEM